MTAAWSRSVRGMPVDQGPTAQGFEVPPYPYDRLKALRETADRLPQGCVDLSAGVPCDPPPPAVREVLSQSDTERSYPPSMGTRALREAAVAWLDRRFGVQVDSDQVAACIGAKELVAGMPHWLRLRSPDRDTVLYPEVSYPSYAMGATLAGCRALPYRKVDEVSPEDAARALCLWVNSPANPTGELIDLAQAAAWGRAHRVPVLSDECYVDFTWDGPGGTILTEGTQGLLAIHSLSKRSNLAGLRLAFYTGDAELVHYLSELRKHAGFMVPGPVQAAGAVALGDEEHVVAQRLVYRRRLDRVGEALRGVGMSCPEPAGSFYLWCQAPDGYDGWGAAAWLAENGGVLVAPGDLYGSAGSDHVRVAVVQPDDRIQLVTDRLRGRNLFETRS